MKHSTKLILLILILLFGLVPISAALLKAQFKLQTRLPYPIKRDIKVVVVNLNAYSLNIKQGNNEIHIPDYIKDSI